MKLEINDSVEFTLGFIFHKKNHKMLVGDELKDKSENPFPYTTRIKLSHISQTPQKYTLKKKKKTQL